MGRRERPLDPTDGPVARLAHDLRQLRRESGNPTYRVLAQRSHYSTSALATAARGDALPTPAVVAAYVAACGHDPAPWLDRLARVADAAPVAGHPGGLKVFDTNAPRFPER
jgi:hypothetical protein